jgi:hypothetical protein
MTTDISSSTGGPTAGRPALRARAATLAAAVLAAVALWAVAALVLDIDLTITTPGRPPMAIGFGAVVAMALLIGLAGWALLAVLERFTRRARTIWTVVAVVVLAGSMAPLLAAEAAGATVVTLALLHLVVGTILIAGLPRARR